MPLPVPAEEASRRNLEELEVRNLPVEAVHQEVPDIRMPVHLPAHEASPHLRMH